MSSGSKKGTQIYYPFLSKSPGKRIPCRFPNGAPVERDTRLQGNFASVSIYISFYLSLRVPIKGSPSMSPNRVPMDREGYSVTRATDLFTYLFIHSFIHSFIPFMYICRSPQKGALLHMGNSIRASSTEPHADGRPIYNGVQPGSPRGPLMTLLYLP